MRFCVLVGVFSLVLVGCDSGGSAPDAQPGDAGADVRLDGGDDGDSSIVDGSLDTSRDSDLRMDGSIDAADHDAGPQGNVVGCEDGLFPARRLASAVASCPASAPGRCWFVDPDGSDEGDGSFDSPFRRPRSALPLLGPGDVLLLRGGVYGDAHTFVGSPISWGDEGAGVARVFLSAGRHVYPDWIEEEAFETQSGTAEAPIVVRSFPGERACVDISPGALNRSRRAIWLGRSGTVSHWRIESITFRGGLLNVSGSVDNVGFYDNEVYGVAVDGGDNPGLIRIDRADEGGPRDISIVGNHLHDMMDADGNEWASNPDVQHFGAVTTLSCENYLGVECGGNGALTIRDNEMFRVPMAFFFKNPSAGPVVVEGNDIHDVVRIGRFAPSNVTFENNTVYRASGGIVLGQSDAAGTPFFTRSGHDLVVRRNTFVGLPFLASFVVQATGHVIRDNIVFGDLVASGRTSWNEPGLIYQSYGDGPRVATIAIGEGNDFDHNCYVGTAEDIRGPDSLVVYGWRGSGTDHVTLADARSALGYDETSVLVTEAEVFVDPAADDYTARADGACRGFGAR